MRALAKLAITRHTLRAALVPRAHLTLMRVAAALGLAMAARLVRLAQMALLRLQTLARVAAAAAQMQAQRKDRAVLAALALFY